MTLVEKINADLKTAMYSKDTGLISVLRMIKTKIMEREKSGPKKDMDDEVVKGVISAYRKSLIKAAVEFGEKGTDASAQLRWEATICDQYLPKTLTGDELLILVKYLIGSMSILDMSQFGKLMKSLTQSHKGLFDVAEVRRIAENILPTNTKK